MPASRHSWQIQPVRWLDMGAATHAPTKAPSPLPRERPIYCPHGHNVLWTTAEWDECAACGARMTAAAEESYCCSLTSTDRI